ncbi:14532_t:CDS:2, partial [Funneliformis caledonium]
DCSKAIHTDTKTRNLVECKYTLHCHDSRWVNPKTSIKNNSVITETVSASKRKKVIKPVEQNHSSYEDTPSDDEPTPTIKYNILDYNDPEIVSDLLDDREDYKILINDEESSTEEDDRTLSEDSKDDILFEQFTASDFDDFDSDLEYRYSNTNINFDDLWIVIVLLETDWLQFKGFPISSYMARKLLGVKRQEKTYVVCPK